MDTFEKYGCQARKRISNVGVLYEGETRTRERIKEDQRAGGTEYLIKGIRSDAIDRRPDYECGVRRYVRGVGIRYVPRDTFLARISRLSYPLPFSPPGTRVDEMNLWLLPREQIKSWKSARGSSFPRCFPPPPPPPRTRVSDFATCVREIELRDRNRYDLEYEIQIFEKSLSVEIAWRRMIIK